MMKFMYFTCDLCVQIMERLCLIAVLLGTVVVLSCFIDVLLAGILMLDCWHLSVCLSFLLIAPRPPWTAVCMTDSCNVYYASHTVFNMPFCTNTRVHHCTC